MDEISQCTFDLLCRYYYFTGSYEHGLEWYHFDIHTDYHSEFWFVYKLSDKIWLSTGKPADVTALVKDRLKKVLGCELPPELEATHANRN